MIERDCGPLTCISVCCVRPLLYIELSLYVQFLITNSEYCYES